jgi:hypothetical protein
MNQRRQTPPMRLISFAPNQMQLWHHAEAYSHICSTRKSRIRYRTIRAQDRSDILCTICVSVACTADGEIGTCMTIIARPRAVFTKPIRCIVVSEVALPHCHISFEDRDEKFFVHFESSERVNNSTSDVHLFHVGLSTRRHFLYFLRLLHLRLCGMFQSYMRHDLPK